MATDPIDTKLIEPLLTGYKGEATEDILARMAFSSS